MLMRMMSSVRIKMRMALARRKNGGDEGREEKRREEKVFLTKLFIKNKSYLVCFIRTHLVSSLLPYISSSCDE